MLIEDVASLKIPYEFGCDEDTEETYGMIEVRNQLDDDVITKWGCSKFVLLFDEEPNFIVKIPFNGMYEFVEANEDDYGRYEFIPFQTEDYCAIEASVYNDALVAGVAQFFTKTEFAGVTINNCPYYISEKAIDFNEYSRIKTPSANSMEKAKSLRSQSELSSRWLALAIDTYGEDAVNQLLQFIKDNDIRDLHSANIGFRAEDGSPVIIDYSGYVG